MSDSVLDGARILVLEDEFLIAMDVEQLCREHGARDVAIVRSVGETHTFDLGSFDVAIIDVMVAGQPSTGFAARLRDARVPFIFASGYAEMDEVFAGFPGVPVVGKPYSSSDLIRAVAAARDGRTA